MIKVVKFLGFSVNRA